MQNRRTEPGPPTATGRAQTAGCASGSGQIEWGFQGPVASACGQIRAGAPGPPAARPPSATRGGANVAPSRAIDCSAISTAAMVRGASVVTR